MTLDDLIYECRTDILDDVARSSGSVSDVLWTDQALARFATQAENEACRRSRILIYDDSTAAYTQFTIVAGTAQYSVNAKVLEIKRIRLPDGTPIEKKTPKELVRLVGDTWRTQEATPMYWTQQGLLLTLVPEPETGDIGTAEMDVYRLPAAPMHTGTWAASTVYALRDIVVDGTYYHQVTTAGTSDSGAPSWNTTVGGTTSDNTVTWTNRGTYNASPEIMEDAQRYLMHWMAYRAFSGHDKETNRSELAEQHKGMFEARFGKESDWTAALHANRQEQPESLIFRPMTNNVRRAAGPIEDDPRLW